TRSSLTSSGALSLARNRGARLRELERPRIGHIFVDVLVRYLAESFLPPRCAPRIDEPHPLAGVVIPDRYHRVPTDELVLSARHRNLTALRDRIRHRGAVEGDTDNCGPALTQGLL